MTLDPHPTPAARTDEGAAPPIGAAPDGCNTKDESSSPKAKKQAFHAAEAEYLTCRAVDLQIAWDAGLRNGKVDAYVSNPKRDERPKYNVPGFPGVVYAKHLPIPYQDCLDKIPRVRLRMLEQEVVLRPAEENGGHVIEEAKVAKYGRWMAQKEVSVVPYLPPQVLGVAHDVSVPLHFVEGPIKALSLISHGLVAIGLGGAEAGFRDPGQHDPAHRDRLHPELGRILWQGRTVFLLPDSGHRENPAVCRGTARLALFLRRQGAIVKIARLPLMRSVTINAEIASLKLDATDVWLAITEARLAPKDNGDLGPDDYLALHQLLGRHLRQEPLVYARERLTRVLDEAALGDPVEWAAATDPSVLDDLLFRALVQEAGEGAIAQVAKALGVGVRAVRAAVKGYAEAASTAPDQDEHPYIEKDGCTWIRTGWLNGEPVLRRLANFTARITVDRVEEDGDEDPRRVFVVEGHLTGGITLPRVEIEASEWLEKAWVPTAWGPKPIIEPGRDTWGHLLAAVQTYSTPKEERIKGSMGWIHEGDAWRYAFPEPGDNGGYGIPAVVESMDTVREALLSSLEIMSNRVGGYEVTYPMYAAIWLAPLAQWVKPDLLLWLAGASGSCKSSLAALLLSHYGRFTYTSLSESWLSTPNAIEYEMWRRKDALQVIDNFVPGLAPDLTAKANRVIQATGDHAARRRLGRDSRIRPSRPPRGVVISTGEDVPSGSSTSTVGRLLVARVKPGQLNLDGLIALSREAHRWPLLMRAYTDWIGKDIEARLSFFRTVQDETVVEYRRTTNGLHARTAGNIAHLIAALSLFRAWAFELGVPSFMADAEWPPLARYCMGRLADTQVSYLDNTRPCDRYRDAIAALLTSGQAMLAGRDYELGEKDIGWYDETHAYLHPDLTWAAVVRFAGGPMQWPYSKTELHRALVDAGYVVRPAGSGTDAARRITTDVRLGSGKGDGRARRRVLVVPRAVLDDAVGLWAKAPSQVTGTRSAELEPDLGLN